MSCQCNLNARGQAPRRSSVNRLVSKLEANGSVVDNEKVTLRSSPLEHHKTFTVYAYSAYF